MASARSAGARREDGVYRRISALAAMLQMLATIYDLEQAELRYGPNFARIGRLPKTLDSVVGAGR